MASKATSDVTRQFDRRQQESRRDGYPWKTVNTPTALALKTRWWPPENAAYIKADFRFHFLSD